MVWAKEIKNGKSAQSCNRDRVRERDDRECDHDRARARDGISTDVSVYILVLFGIYTVVLILRVSSKQFM